MSIADHFDHAPDAGFVRDYDRSSARRQFNVSLVLLSVIVLAGTSLGFLIRFDGPSSNSYAPSMVVDQPPAYAGKL